MVNKKNLITGPQIVKAHLQASINPTFGTSGKV